MKTMNGITNELLVKKARKNWKTRCGAFLLAAIATLYGGNAVLGDVIITTGQAHQLPDNWNFANTPNVGYPVPASAHSQFVWNAAVDLLNNLDVEFGNSITVNTIQTVAPNAPGTQVLDSRDAITLNGGSGNSTVRVNNDMNWIYSTFTVTNGSGTIQTRGGSTLNLGSQLRVNAGGTLILETGDGTRYTNSAVTVSGGNNSGAINVVNSVLNLGALGGAGEIDLGILGVINLTSGNVSNNIRGHYNNMLGDTRGYINIDAGNISTLSGHIGGSIGFIGGGMVYLNNDNSGSGFDKLTSLYIEDYTTVKINQQNRVGDANTGIILENYGTLAKSETTGANVDVANGIYVNNQGGLASANTSTVDWKYNANSLNDAGHRLNVTGEISSAGLNATLNINRNTAFAGTVALSGSNNQYRGNFNVYSGVLEVTGQDSLGVPYENQRYSISVGDMAENPLDRAVFRVVGPKQQPAEVDILHDIKLNTAQSTYEVFTVDNGAVDPGVATMADKDRFTVHQVGQITGAGSLNKNGDGVLVLDAQNNTYSGNTIIWNGVLQISNPGSINNDAASYLYIGGDTRMEEKGFRPVFETTTGAVDTNTMTIKPIVVINETNSVIRTTGVGNETILTNTVTSGTVPGSAGDTPYAAILNKDGAGTLTLHGTGNWGINGTGELKILQGTVQFRNQSNLTSGKITLGTDSNNYKDIESFEKDGVTPITYKATLKLEDNCGDVAIGNAISLASTPVSADPSAGSTIEVGVNSRMTVGGVTEEVTQSNLNKTGLGELVLNGVNGFTGWTNISAGSVRTAVADNLASSAGVNLVGKNTALYLDADNTVKNLIGGDATADPNELDPANWTRTVDIGNNKLTVATTTADSAAGLGNVLYGNIVSGPNGLLVKSGVSGSTLAAGFTGFNGGFQIDSGDIRMLTDGTVTSLTGKSGTHLDLYGNTLTVDIGSNYQYSGTIVNTLPNTTSAGRYGTLVKKGAGTLTTNFTEFSTGRAFNGSVTLQEGSIKSTSDFTMAAGNTMTFYVHTNASGGVTPLVFDISGYRANFSAASILNVVVDDATAGWSEPSGRTILGEIDGNDTSNYDGLKTSTTNSLFLSFDKEIRTSAGRRDMLIVANASGFAGLGDSFNEVQVGTNLDNIRTQDMTNNPCLANIFKALWAAGSNVTTPEARATQTELIRGVYRELSGDVMANAVFMGLDSPWKRPFDRLNLDSQMVYVYPQQQRQYRPYPTPAQQYRGQSPMVANMRNIWFTPTYQGVRARSDGNARGFNIERPGFQLGWDKRVAPNSSIGLMLGYSSPSLHQNNDIIDAADFQVGLYGGAMLGYFVEVKGFIGFGHQNYKSSRTVDLRPLGMPTQSAHGTFDGDTFNFSLEIARPLFLGFTVLRPIIGLDSEHAFRYAFAEDGDCISMRYGRSSISRTRMRFALDLETCTLERMIWHGRLGYSANLGGNDYAETTAQFINVYSPEQTIRSVAVGTSYFEAGVGVKYFLNPAKTLSLVADYDASIADRWAEHRGVVGITYIY